MLCLMSELNTLQVASGYNNESFATSNVMSRDSFEKQRDGIYKFSARLGESYMEFMLNIFGLSTIYSSFKLRADATTGNINIEPGKFENCSCITSMKTCSTQGGFYEYDSSSQSMKLIYPVVGIRMGCSPFRSTLQSTFDCWYSAGCLEEVCSKK